VTGADGRARDELAARRRVRRASRLLSLAVVVVLALASGVPGGAPARTSTAFDGGAALRHVERLVALGPRPAGSPAATRARQYIAAQLQRVGLETRVEPFEAETPHGRLAMANILALVPGRRTDAILIGGHYDTKWFRDNRFVGANDGGSSAGFLIELARWLRSAPREFTYWIAFFDGEEARERWTATDSLYGSRRMAAEMARAGRLPRAVLVVDMIGDRDLGIRREAFSTEALSDLVWAAAHRRGHARHFLPGSLAVEDDHAPFLRAGVPATLLIDFDFPPWHTADDTLDKISARSLQVVGEVLLDALPEIEAWLARSSGRPRS
jgi:Zn-dependent M28 family amino/carboxypeptidase